MLSNFYLLRVESIKFSVFAAGNGFAAAEALLMLLHLPEKPLLDPLVEDLLATQTAAEAMELITSLSSPKRNVFVHLCMFLREGIERKYYNAFHVGKCSTQIYIYSKNCYKRIHS